MVEWILYDYYVRETEDEEVTENICSLLKLGTPSQFTLINKILTKHREKICS
jgi:hypothetical protein